MIFLLALFCVPLAIIMFITIVSWLAWPLLLIIMAVAIVCMLTRRRA